jgi:multiple sugar transport system ATP-binding protein
VALQRGQRVLLGLRSEDIVIELATTHQAATTVSLVEPMGSTTIIYAPLGGKLIACQTEKETALTAGSPIGIGIAPGRLHLFDPTTEAALAIC